MKGNDVFKKIIRYELEDRETRNKPKHVVINVVVPFEDDETSFPIASGASGSCKQLIELANKALQERAAQLPLERNSDIQAATCPFCNEALELTCTNDECTAYQMPPLS